ncbi:DUF4468 domain-containing protein [Hymenobacter lapidiphilus]|uniref:DUF4468 domain-containing protein n=1 Tax=Hymenobacter sp. CCM 8763 TaxID=2303334 RepID=UPI000E892800|nr:DUF4468 domain-containing protein [Hymenobacter sp. CCM 8763]RFP65932.1 DUF4468 domain-containing protein [Hymenobacter sp. CCM 8763]
MRLTLLTIVFLLCCFVTRAQEIVFPVDPDTGKVTYSDVVQVPGATQAELYARAQLWAAKTFPSTDATVQLSDAATGRVVARGWDRINIVVMGFGNPFKLWFLVQLDCKDGRYRSIVTDLEYQGEYNPKVTVMSAAQQTARTPAEANLLTKNSATHNKKGELRPVIASYRKQTDETVRSIQAGIKAALTAAQSGGVSNSDF